MSRFEPEKSPAEYAVLPDPFNEEADLETRAKAYLQVNCAMCHAASGGGNSRIELSFTTSMDKAHLINERPMHDTMGLVDPRLVFPGDPDRSLLYRRLTRRGLHQMPPTSTNRVDERGAKLISDWISQLEILSERASNRTH